MRNSCVSPGVPRTQKGVKSQAPCVWRPQLLLTLDLEPVISVRKQVEERKCLAPALTTEGLFWPPKCLLTKGGISCGNIVFHSERSRQTVSTSLLVSKRHNPVWTILSGDTYNTPWETPPTGGTCFWENCHIKVTRLCCGRVAKLFYTEGSQIHNAPRCSRDIVHPPNCCALEEIWNYAGHTDSGSWL